MNDTLKQLVAMSRTLGDPENDYVILGEETPRRATPTAPSGSKRVGISFRRSARRASCAPHWSAHSASLTLATCPMAKSSSAFWTPVSILRQAVGLLPTVTSARRQRRFSTLSVSAWKTSHLSATTHATAINALTCSKAFPEAFAGRLFPMRSSCGPAPVIVSYTDPGIPLAREIKRRIDAYQDAYGERPRVILMQNHGLVALGHSAEQVENITAMMVKTARVLLGTVCRWWSIIPDFGECRAHSYTPRRGLSPQTTRRGIASLVVPRQTASR